MSVIQSSGLQVDLISPLLNAIEIQVIQLVGRKILKRKISAHSVGMKLKLTPKVAVEKDVFGRIISYCKNENYTYR